MIPQIRAIVGPLLLVPAPMMIDQKQATDLIIFVARDMRIAARVRRPGYADRYPFDFTIRAHRDSGAETELSKIRHGFGDWMFYGHADGTNTISRWFVIDLHVFRSTLIAYKRDPKSSALKWKKQDNRDGTRFLAFDVRYFPKPILIASHDGCGFFCS